MGATPKKLPAKNVTITDAAVPQPPSTAEMLATALSKGAPPEVVREMAALLREERDDKRRMAFNGAMANVKAKLPIIRKTKAASFGAGKGYKYADLAEIQRETAPLLQEAGIVQTFESECLSDGRLRMTSILAHEDGYERRSTLEVPYDRSGSKNELQALGSASTYAQKYLTLSALGLATDVDDDGMASSGEPRISAEQLKILQEKIEAAAVTMDMFCTAFGGIASVDALPASRYDEAVARMEKRAAALRRKAGNERPTADTGMAPSASG